MALKRRGFAIAALATLATVLGAAALKQGSQSASTASITLTVSAAASLQDALGEVVAAYEDSHPDRAIVLNFASSGALQQQIEQGAPVDLFLSAAPRQMDALQAKGLLLPESRRDLLGNRIVLVAPLQEGAIAQFADLTTDAVSRIVMGEPESVPAGTYSQETLLSLNIYDQVQPKLVFAKDVRQALTYVESGNVSAGLVYATDAALSTRVRTVATAPPNSHAPILYPVAILKNSRQPEAALAFADFLTSATATAIFEQYGFISIS